MKNILKILIIQAILVQATFALEYSIYGGGGLHTLIYDVKNGERNNGAGGFFGFGYTHFFTPNWSLGSGVEIAFYNAQTMLKTTNLEYNAIDFENNPFIFRSRINDYKEDNSVMLLQIPIMFQYVSNETYNKAFYYALGIKIGIPQTGKNETSYTSITNSGFYSYENYEYTDQEFMGFGTFGEKKVKKDLTLQTVFLLSAETGVRWKLSDGLRLYTGIYFDYGQNSAVKKQGSDKLVEYAKQEDGKAFALNSPVKEAVPLALGFKLKLSFDTEAVARAEARRRAEEEEARRYAKAAETEALRKAAEEEAARMASIETGKAEILQAKIDSIQNQVLNDFRITQTKPNEKQIPALDAIIALLKDHPELRFYLNGHTCDKGDKEVNRRVGYERAKAIKDYVIEKGIDEKRVLGIGSKLYYEPLVPNTSEENRRMNRRVEFVIEKWLPVEDNDNAED
ncbi:MAG: OmpA family protein [Fibromonadales bacterium]|nr:OmpA family protein [Fibromonadales bacterium]